MIKITDQNKSIIVEDYVSCMLENLDSSDIYSICYNLLIEKKSELSYNDLENEISLFYPHILDDTFPEGRLI